MVVCFFLFFYSSNDIIIRAQCKWLAVRRFENVTTNPLNTNYESAGTDYYVGKCRLSSTKRDFKVDSKRLLYFSNELALLSV